MDESTRCAVEALAEARQYLISGAYEPDPQYSTWIRMVEELPQNQSGTDKTWVEEAMAWEVAASGRIEPVELRSLDGSADPVDVLR